MKSTEERLAEIRQIVEQYRYTLNDPVNFVDPSGLTNWTDTLGGLGLIITGGAAIVGGTAITPVAPFLGPIGVVIGTSGVTAGGILFIHGLLDDGSDSSGTTPPSQAPGTTPPGQSPTPPSISPLSCDGGGGPIASIP